jgi:hypothetical protein
MPSGRLIAGLGWSPTQGSGDIKRERFRQMDQAGDQPVNVPGAGAAIQAEQAQQRRQEAMKRRKRMNKLQESIINKIGESIVYGAGVPAEGIVPAKQLGLDLPPNEQGLPAVGLDPAKLQASLTPREMRYVQRWLAQQAQQGTGGVRQ